MEYKFIIATPLSMEEFKQKSAINIYLDKMGYTATVFPENKEGLSKIYNSVLNEDNRGKRLIFVHDDVLIEDIFLFEKLDLAFEKFDIVGLAGAKTCDLNAPMKAWHLMAPQDSFVGEVAHSKNGINWTTVFGQTPSRALMIDGLFIAVNTDKLLDTNTKFDEDFDFHHYDMAFCLNANKNKVKVGVYPIRVVHFGLGDSMNTMEWTTSANKFSNKYKA